MGKEGEPPQSFKKWPNASQQNSVSPIRVPRLNFHFIHINDWVPLIITWNVTLKSLKNNNKKRNLKKKFSPQCAFSQELIIHDPESLVHTKNF